MIAPGGPRDFHGGPQGSQASSRVKTWKSAFLSSSKSNVRLPHTFPELFLGLRALPGLFCPILSRAAMY